VSILKVLSARIRISIKKKLTHCVAPVFSVSRLFLLLILEKKKARTCVHDGTSGC
jgi:hypothetical protein